MNMEYTIDNRDTSTTWLWIGDSYIEVNPYELMVNVIENSHLEENEQERLIRHLDVIQNDLSK